MSGTNPQSATARKGKKKKSGTGLPTLQIRNCPTALLDRINGAAGFLHKSRDEFVAELLAQDLKYFERIQGEAQEWWKKRCMLDSEK
jgi:hypothetical protein